MPAPSPSFASSTSCIVTARTCVRHLAGSPRAAARQKLFFVLERSSTLSERQPVPPPFLHACPWRSPTARLSVLPMAVLTCTVVASRASLYSFATHLARTLGFPGCPLSVSAYPVLMGALPVSRGHTSLETLVYILWRRMYSTSSRLAWRTALNQAICLCCHASAIPPTR